MPRCLRLISVICLMLFSSAVAKAAALQSCQTALMNIQASTDVDAAPCTEYFFDTSGKTEIGDILLMDNIFKTGDSVPPLGYRVGKYWLRMKLNNGTDSPQETIISLSNPMTRFARAWLVRPHESPILIATRPDADSPAPHQPVHRDTILKIPLPNSGPQTILVEAGAVAQNYQPVVRSREAYDHTVRLEYLFFGLYFGVIAIMALYNATLYFIVRDVSYLLYVGTIIFFHGLLFSTITGGSKYLFPGHEKIAMMHMPATTVIAFVTALTFSMNFLNSKVTHPRLHSFLKIVRILFSAQFIALMINYHPSIVAFGVSLQLIIFSVIIFIAFENAYKNDRSAKIFLAGWALMLCGWYSWLFAQMGFYHHNFFTLKGMLFGSATEIALFSFALGDKINTMRKEKDNALRRELSLAHDKAHLEAEMLAATAVQETLLPAQLTGDHFEVETFYHAAEKVGGDWLWHSTDPKTGHLYAYVGDVTGHGVPSALMTGVICGATAALEDEFRRSHPPLSPQERLLRTAEVLNQVVAQTGSRSNRWVTMCLICVEPETGLLTYVNAGHPFPFVWRRKEGTIESVANSGTLLGNADCKFQASTTHLADEDILMIYTDGFLEARDQAIHSQGKPRRKELLELFQSAHSASHLKQLLITKLEPVLEDLSKVTDDVTFILIRKTNSERSASKSLVTG